MYSLEKLATRIWSCSWEPAWSLQGLPSWPRCARGNSSISGDSQVLILFPVQLHPLHHAASAKGQVSDEQIHANSSADRPGHGLSPPQGHCPQGDYHCHHYYHYHCLLGSQDQKYLLGEWESHHHWLWPRQCREETLLQTQEAGRERWTLASDVWLANN